MSLTASTPIRQAGLTQLVLLLAGSCLSVLGAVLIAPVLPQMTDHFAGVPGADALVPIVLTVPALIIGLTAPFAGFIADRIDRKRVLVAAMVGYSIFGTAPLYLDSLPAIIGSRVLVGLCEAAIMTCCTTLIADYWSGPRRSRYLGMQTLLASVSATVFLGLGGALGSSGWRTPFWLYTVAVALAVPMAMLIWQPARPAVSAALPPIPWRQLRVPCLVTLAGGVVFYALIVELSFVLDEVGVTATATIGALSALMSLATAVAAGSFAKLSGQTPRTLLPIAFGLSAAGFLVIAATPSVPVITIGAVLTGAGTGLLLPTLLTWATNGLSFEERGRGTGLWTGTLFIGEFFSPILITGVGAAVGGLRPALGLLGVVAAILAVVMVMVVPRDAPRLNITQVD
ncbi:putative MFS transporter [Actinoplanes missouriensis 431]|uniref:Putative MFS transporter n=1 Tax=Actinoplanes missouriensis (strain ATCC 14538 / DSM 43046 / CBS 188.64 / JCM 3121 / NBRC 102363 / NCIMB 12654 / NRRL B-3342 / UNCC 431) TaxID=512565 RepID=I0H7B0_ACTM4|nr:MFS transporter [Actinoplanes missouriensis]BAL88897.1 putative MFS transporter [Actinoplanes missouriensis 431]